MEKTPNTLPLKITIELPSEIAEKLGENSAQKILDLLKNLQAQGEQSD